MGSVSCSRLKSNQTLVGSCHMLVPPLFHHILQAGHQWNIGFVTSLSVVCRVPSGTKDVRTQGEGSMDCRCLSRVSIQVEF